MKSFLAILAIIITLLSTGCKKFVDVDPPSSSINGANVYGSDATAIATLTTLYTQMAEGSNFTGSTSISVFAGLSADELTLFDVVTGINYIDYYQNALSTQAVTGSDCWILYGNLFTCNSAVEGLSASNTLTPSVKQQLLGEAKFMRAFYYFYLVNLFGDVPLAVSSNYQVNSILARSPKATVYSQMVMDLKDAQTLLSQSYLDGNLLPYTVAPEHLRPTSWAATALLARVYLYEADWADAKTQATTVINNADYSLVPLNQVFKMNSSEAIWQLQPVNTGWNTQDARVFIVPPSGPSGDTWPVHLSWNLLDSFETGDQRRINWVDSVIVGDSTYYFPYKYQSATLNAPVTEYLMLLRLGEQYLIRAEAESRSGDLSDAASDLNAIRTRAGLPNTTASDQADLFAAIQHERQMELFTELGQRWLDMKRIGTVDGIMNKICPQKGGTWNINWALYPIPLSEIQKDPNLTENSGY